MLVGNVVHVSTKVVIEIRIKVSGVSPVDMLVWVATSVANVSANDETCVCNFDKVPMMPIDISAAGVIAVDSTVDFVAENGVCTASAL